MVKLRKELAGSSSHGHEWPEDGAVVEVPDEHAAELLRFPDGGFSEVEDEDENAAGVDEAPTRGRRRRRDDSAEVSE